MNPVHSRAELLEQLTCERYGAAPAVRSKHPTAAEVLAFESMQAYDQARLRRRALAESLGVPDDYKPTEQESS